MSAAEEEFVGEIERGEEDESDSGPFALKKLREKLKKAVDEKQENLDGWQRARADLANFKRDESQRSVDQEVRLKSKVAETLIPTLDSFEMALKDTNYKGKDAGFKAGFEATYSHLLKSLERLDIVRFDPKGEAFDPYKHEALGEVETDAKEKDHTVESVHRSGYSITLPDGSERVIRPAQVSVYAYHQQ